VSLVQGTYLWKRHDSRQGPPARALIRQRALRAQRGARIAAHGVVNGCKGKRVAPRQRHNAFVRIAFAGLSAPLFYDYGHQAKPGPADTSSSPNPILDSPFGAILLYDELWFLTRSLCPQNMRHLPYVRFLDEEEMLPDLTSLDVTELERLMRDTPGVEVQHARATALFADYDRILEAMGIDWGTGQDNHTHTLRVRGLETSANSASLHSILTDIAVLQELGRTDVELLANSYAQVWVEDIHPEVRVAPLTEVLTIDRIPSALTPEGPYDPSLEEVRANPYLRDFRKWVTKTGATDAREAADIKHDVERILDKTVVELVNDKFGHGRGFFSTGKTLTAAAADLVMPGSGTLASVISDLRSGRATRKRRWQAFLITLPLHSRRH
jgi:hypothetical protein